MSALQAPPSDASGAGMTESIDYSAMLSRLEQVESELQRLKRDRIDPNGLNLLVFDGSKDKLLAAFVMATGAAACGMTVKMFFTFWATAALRKGTGQAPGKSLTERAFGWMLPASARTAKLSRMEMGGLGRRMLEREMRGKNVADLDRLIGEAAELGVAISVCEMSMQLMGIRREELIDYPGVTFCGVAKFVDEASTANTTLFI